MGADWQIVPLSHCGEWLSGGTPSKSRHDYWNGSIPWVSPKDMDTRFIWDTEDHISDEAAKSGSRLIPEDTILFVVRSMTLAHSFQLAITKREVAFNQDIKAIKCNSLVHPQFLFYALLARANEILGLVDEASHGTKRLQTDVMQMLLIPLPPIREQRAIAAILGALDDKIELNRRMNETLEAMARALFESWFVDFDPVRAKMEGRQPAGVDADTAALFPDGFENSPLGDIPSGWRIAGVGDVARIVGGGTPSTKVTAFWEGGRIHWATPKDLAGLPNMVLLDTDRRITETGLQQISSGLLPKGTVLLSSRAPIGYLAIAELPVAINQGFIAMLSDGILSNHYLLQWAHANMETIKAHANGTTFQEISKANFRPISVLVPPQPVVGAFTSRASTLYQQIVANLRQSQMLAKIRDELLPRLLSGELRVRNVEPFANSDGSGSLTAWSEGTSV